MLFGQHFVDFYQIFLLDFGIGAVLRFNEPGVVGEYHQPAGCAGKAAKREAPGVFRLEKFVKFWVAPLAGHSNRFMEDHVVALARVFGGEFINGGALLPKVDFVEG
ncbi:MAG: hypothetical protein DYG96_09620 [Chlorobi bacterium CHB2]|nr:hypothetical protein [Chlorobi bacterium CHB2]